METILRLIAILTAVLTFGMTVLMLFTFRKERRIGRFSPLVSAALSLLMPPVFMLLGGARVNPLLGVPILAVGLVVGFMRGMVTKLTYRDGQVMGRNSMLFLLGWGGSLAAAQLLNSLGSTVLASAGLLSVFLSTGTQVGINANLFLRRRRMAPPAASPVADEARPGLQEQAQASPWPPSVPERGPVGAPGSARWEEKDAQAPPQGTPPPAEVVSSPSPTSSNWWKWVGAGCGGFLLLLVVAAGVLVTVRGRWRTHRAVVATQQPVQAVATEIATALVLRATPIPTSIPIEEEAPTRTAELTPVPTRQAPAIPTRKPTPTTASAIPFSVRPYDADRDSGLESLVERAADFTSATEPGLYQWQVTFPAGAPALISMGWCAVDRGTLDDNWSHWAYELWIDGFPIELSQLALTISRSDELFCRGYEGVVTGWDREAHFVQWTRRVNREINDGMRSYPAGDYVLRFDVEMVDRLNEEFTGASAGWVEGDYASDRIWIEGGEYHVLLKKPHRIAAVAHREDRYADFYLVAGARLVDEIDGEYGVVFRYQDPENTYYFRVSADGRYRLGKRVEGDWVDLVPWTPSGIISQDPTDNRLWVTCEGNSIAAYVNGQEVASVTDDTFADGYVGVMAGSFGQPDVHVAFDYIVVEAMAAE